ncbi:MAG: hypothetical protein CMQ11_07175 [Gammaproteobacteria bacterium]|nr:hypothetical protein [Gammaproteobacteria bacterium]
MTDAKTPTPTASKTTTAAVQSDPAKLPEVESNHNTLDPAKPVETAQVKSMPDYNPQRKKSSFANVQSDTTKNAHDDEKLVDTKGDNETVEERDATSPWGEKTGASAEGAEDGTDAAKAPTNKASPPADKSATKASEAAKK